MILDRINGPQDIRKVPKKDLKKLAQEIREFLIQSISETGGHLASNLGVVELTMAMYLAFPHRRTRLSGMWDISPTPIKY